MKKIALLLFSIFAVFGFVACNGDTTAITTAQTTGGSETTAATTTASPLSYMDAPTNLEINGTVLSWDAVADATGYIVYVDGVEQATVTTNSYDFTAIAEDGQIFQVKTQAATGKQASALSVTIAYVANAAAEVLAIEQVMSDMQMDVPEGFALELVNKGMTATQFQAMATALQVFSTTMSNTSTPDEALAALNTMLASVDNIEAIISAIVKTVLPGQIQNEITMMQQQITMYQGWIDQNPGMSDYYQQAIDQLQAQITMMTQLKTELQNNPDQMVQAITATVNYILSIEAMISQDLIDTITSLVQTDSITNLNVADLIVVKDEIVQILRDTKPTQADMVLIIQVMNSMMAMSGNAVQVDYSIEDYEGKLAQQSLLMFDAFINFIDGMDSAFFTSIISAIQFNDYGPTQESMGEVLILFVKYIAEYKDANQTLFDQIDAVFSNAERQTMYEEALAALADLEQLDAASLAILQSIDFQTIMALETSMEGVFDALLNQFVATDGEIIRLIIQMNGFRSDWYTGDYYNDATGDTYAYEAEFEHAKSQVTFLLANEIAGYVNAILDITDVAGYQSAVGVILDMAGAILPSMLNDKTQPTAQEATQLLGVVEVFMTDCSQDQYNLVKNLVAYIVDENVFGQLATMEDDIYQYMTTTYGDDYYENSPTWYMDDYGQYAMAVTIGAIYDGFMDATNRGYVDNIIGALATALKDDTTQALTGLTDQQVVDMQDALSNLLDVGTTVAAALSTYDYTNLTAADKTAIQGLISQLQVAAQALDPNYSGAIN